VALPVYGALRIWVLDSGEGIPLSEQDKIFEPFYRRGTELRRETAGIGIGLSIVKHIAEAHRGRITVDSTTGRGSTFTLHIP
jgi:signal transduction histidine kinase